jgi:hypothetical protein
MCVCTVLPMSVENFKKNDELQLKLMCELTDQTVQSTQATLDILPLNKFT